MASEPTPEPGDVILLCERLLELAESEQRAVEGRDLQDLEACSRRKEEIVQKLREAGKRSAQAGDPHRQPGFEALLEKALAANVGVTRGIGQMLEECRRAMVAVRAGQRAELAYQETRRKRRERSTKVL